MEAVAAKSRESLNERIKQIRRNGCEKKIAREWKSYPQVERSNR